MSPETGGPARKPAARLATAARRRRDMLRHRGDAVACPICGGRWTAFKDDWNRPDALCWRCGSHERHRAQWQLLTERPELLERASSLLHFAPEYCLRDRLEAALAASGGRYVTADLDPAGVDLALDLMDLDLPDGAFDAVICSHVLEHVPDDARAIAELRRVTAPGGWCLVMVPLDLGREHTYEDPAITTPEARQEAFWQFDHVRRYAPDLAHRLQTGGFDVEVIRPHEAFGAAAAERAGILPADWIFLGR
jgi:SAM-dependent methyltransferase